jgi:hypothetical protein
MNGLQPLLLTLWMGLVPGPQTLDAALHDTRDGVAQLSRFRGKPTLVFYEDQKSRHQNDVFKRELWNRGRSQGLLATTHVVAVADLRPYDFFALHGLALQHLRDVERDHAIPVLADWKGALSQPPWNLPRSASSVVLLDGAGHPVYVHSGPLSGEEMEHLFGLLGQLIHEDR